MRYEALSFDLDGTLIDYSVSSARALEAIGGHRSDLPVWYEVSAGVEAALDRGLIPVAAFERDRIRRFHRVRFGRPPSEAELRGLVAARRDAVLDAVRVFPDAARLLASAAALGVECVAVSNSYAALREEILDRLDLARAFSHVAFCGDGAHRKPDRRAFAAALGVLGRPAESVLHIGDEVDADVVGARNAGLAGVHVRRSGGVCAPHGVCVPSLDLVLERRGRGFTARFGTDAAAPA
ncbi:HAD family hydrolase [Streptomyces sp. ODS05-4]|uniref:HAD family hydrolase n=1 Tax=Streptomyces sp. ODS05-4 TaxID=2944939 RepID=UPI00210B6AFB|nr:HAD family hydrolase [Streptomyces sp. ODS05-4]